jgi:hypothetical protein
VERFAETRVGCKRKKWVKIQCFFR